MDEPLKKTIYDLLKSGITTVEGLKAKLPATSTDEIYTVLHELEREKQLRSGDLLGRDTPVGANKNDEDETQEINAVKP